MAALTYFDGHLMVIVPAGTVTEREDGRRARRPPRCPGPAAGRATAGGTRRPGLCSSRFGMSAGNGIGMIFVTTLCLVIDITNIHLRGLWSVFVILGIVSATILLAVLGWWDPILRTIGGIDVHINALGYFSIGLFLFAIWGSPSWCTTASCT